MHRVSLLIGVLLIAGCADSALFDPYKREGTWVPTGANDANLRAMVANPHDLVEGTGEHASSGAEAAPPVARVLAGKRYPLPQLNAASVDIVTNQPSQQGSANPGTAQ
jgi:hypothetical protein